MATIRQEQVLAWIRSHLGVAGEASIVASNGQLGPDWIWRDGLILYHFEAIAFSDRTATGTLKRGKNQADFWKAFSQAISRLNPASRWGSADRIVIAVPSEFLAGWSSRVGQIGRAVWDRIGLAFPELEVWFAAPTGLLRLSWSEAFDAPAAVSRVAVAVHRPAVIQSSTVPR
jgi:hypothetical protein